jgi:hypothetical protein
MGAPALNEQDTFFEVVTRSRAEALDVLTARYAEHCERHPRTREIPLALYTSRNLRAAMGPFIRRERRH